MDWSTNLPVELTLTAFGFLDAKSLCALSSTCLSWKALAHQPSLWFTMCKRTQSVIDHDKSRHWKDKFKERHSWRKSFLNRRANQRIAFIVISVLLCTLFSLYSLNEIYLQHMRLTYAEPVVGTIHKAYIVEHEGELADFSDNDYEIIIEYIFTDTINGRESRSSNLWVMDSVKVRYSTLSAAESELRRLSRPDGSILLLVHWDNGTDPYPFVYRTALFEPYAYLVIAITGLCVIALVDVMSRSIIHVQPDTTDLKVYSRPLGRYLYPISDDQSDDIPRRRQQGVFLLFSVIIFHVIVIPAVAHFMAISMAASLVSEIWIFLGVAELVAMYTAYQARIRLLCHVKAFLYCDRRPTLVLNAPNLIHVVLQTQRSVFIQHVSIVASLTRVDCDVVVTPGEPDRTKLVYRLVHEQDVQCSEGVHRWYNAGEHVIDSTNMVINGRLQTSSVLSQTGFPRFIWRLAVVVRCQGLPTVREEFTTLVQDGARLPQT
uniref:F-box domain-containing protein n=1 Tax=Spongospora subterranea TaxID=70186 RepID=A0A0H5QHU6_9EUKA|eukprot:CRZ01615.1 hypothetical protein [Spongospora subterranea]